jgi:hypothetical protein
MTLKAIDKYFRSYDKSSFAVFACQGQEPSEAEVSAFERVVGFALPPEFREFTMSPLGGLYMEVREELWPRPEPYEVAPFWSFLRGIKVFGIAKDIPEWLDLREQYKKFCDEGVSELVPFLQRLGDANRYCFNSRGQIIEWDHEQPGKRQLLEMSFSDLVMREINELEERKDRKLRGEDKRRA